MSMKLGRRGFLAGAGALVSVGGGLERLEAAPSGARPKNIIWMVADGMSAGVLPMAEHFSMRARGQGTIWQALHGRPSVKHALMDMASLDSIVTDSSSASSSWGTGSRIFNAWVNMLPDGTKLVPIAELARDKRKRVGLVTTATVTHATPAGFAAVSRKRDDEALIAEQYVNRCDVVLGGGRKFFAAAGRKDKRDLLGEYRKAGFATVLKRAEMLAATGGDRLLGLFGDGFLPYTLDQRGDAKLRQEVPTLAEMTQVALDKLAKSRDGFLLQVEGARVDHAAHNNDAAAMLWDQIAFDDAIGVVIRFAEKHPDTLVVITTDHGNSNPGLNGSGTEYRDSNLYFDRLLAAKNSFVVVTPRFGAKAEYTMKLEGEQDSRPKASADHIRHVVKDAFGIVPKAEEIDSLRSAAAGIKGMALSRQSDKLVGVLGQVLGNYTGIGWTGTSHTSDYTVVTALGPGSERFHGFVRNTDVFSILCEFMDVKYRNPAMAPERAKEFRQVASASLRHWV